MPGRRVHHSLWKGLSRKRVVRADVISLDLGCNPKGDIANDLSKSEFATAFAMTADTLSAHAIDEVIVDQCPGVPCRISLSDVPVGERVLLLNYEHLPEDSPYRARHAIYVWDKAVESHPAPGHVPDVITRRLIAVRGFNRSHRIVTGDVVEGNDVAECINALFEDAHIDYIHLHNAKHGCFAAKVTRA
jgi:hypothetical protein